MSNAPTQPPADDGGLLHQKLRKFINVIDELRDVGLHHVISLPRIAVLGSQSAGKSSIYKVQSLSLLLDLISYLEEVVS